MALYVAEVPSVPKLCSSQPLLPPFSKNFPNLSWQPYASPNPSSSSFLLSKSANVTVFTLGTSKVLNSLPFPTEVCSNAKVLQGRQKKPLKDLKRGRGAARRRLLPHTILKLGFTTPPCSGDSRMAAWTFSHFEGAPLNQRSSFSFYSLKEKVL